MALVNDTKKLLNHIEQNRLYFDTNSVLFDMYEGDMLKYVLAAAKRQFSPQAFESFKDRIPALNTLKRMIDKLSKIYMQPGPSRTIEEGNENDSELLTWYEDQFDMNVTMNCSNEATNLYKNNWIQPFINRRRQPKLRVVQSSKFLPYSDDARDPLDPTHIILDHGKTEINGKEVQLYFVFTDTEFMVFDSEENIHTGLMGAFENAEGTNPLGELPGIYLNRSKNLLIPKQDSDTISMNILIPLLLGDLNHIINFTAFPIRVGVNINKEDLIYAANALWFVEGMADTDKPPSFQTLDTNVDYNGILTVVQSQLAMWLQSRNVKPGTIGTTSPEQAASGISRIIDEADTTEERKKAVEFYTGVEDRFWSLLMHKIHPYWVSKNLIDNKALFSPNARVVTNFAEQVPLQSRGDLVRDLRDEVSSGFMTKAEAIAILRPHLTEEEIAEVLTAIKEEKSTSTIIEEEPEEIEEVVGEIDS